MRWRIRGAPDRRSSSQLSMLLDGRIAHAAGLNSPTDYALELKLGRPFNSKDPISLELVGKICVNYASSSSLRHPRFLVFLLLGYAGFLRVDELHSLRVGDISLLMTIWQSPSASEKTTSIEKAIQFTSPCRGRSLVLLQRLEDSFFI